MNTFPAMVAVVAHSARQVQTVGIVTCSRKGDMHRRFASSKATTKPKAGGPITKNPAGAPIPKAAQGVQAAKGKAGTISKSAAGLPVSKAATSAPVPKGKAGLTKSTHAISGSKPKSGVPLPKLRPSTIKAYRPPPPRPMGGYQAAASSITKSNPQTRLCPWGTIQFDPNGELAVYGRRGKHVRGHVGPTHVKHPGDTEFFRLPDGRTLCYSDLGSRTGKGAVLVNFHGTPGSRLDKTTLSNQTALQNRGIRVIGIDRPGYGHSTFTKYSIMSFVADVEALLAHLGVGAFYVSGTSGGGPYALACTYHFPASRVRATGLMCTTAPNAAGASGGGLGDQWTMFVQKVAPNWARAKHEKLVPPEARWALYENNLHDRVHEDIMDEEKYRQAYQGQFHDLSVHRGDWGFDFANIVACNPIHMYHGTRDTNNPHQGAEWIRDQLPKQSVRWTLVPGEDHVGVQKYWYTMLQDMLQSRG